MTNFLDTLIENTKQKKKDKYVLVASKRCGTCKIVREELDKGVKSGEIEYEVIDVDTTEGKKTAKRLNIEYVPTLFEMKGGRLRKEIIEFEDEDESDE